MSETTMMETGIEQESKETEKEEVKPYTFRRLQSTDVFLMSKIIGKIGVNEFTACFEKDGVKKLIASFTDEAGEKADIASVVGISVSLEIANVILGNLPKCEKEIFQMLSSVTGLSFNHIEKLDMVVFIEMVIDFIKKEEFKDFIKVVSRLLK